MWATRIVEFVKLRLELILLREEDPVCHYALPMFTTGLNVVAAEFFKSFIAYHRRKSISSGNGRASNQDPAEQGQLETLLITGDPKLMASKYMEAVLVTAFDRETNSSGAFEFLEMDGYTFIVEKLKDHESPMAGVLPLNVRQVDGVDDLRNLRNEYINYVVAMKRLGKEPVSFHEACGPAFWNHIRLLQDYQTRASRELIDAFSLSGVILREIDVCCEFLDRGKRDRLRVGCRREQMRQRALQKQGKKGSFNGSPRKGKKGKSMQMKCRKCNRAGHFAKSCDL